MTRLTMNMKEYYSASELAAMALPGLPKTERAIQIKAKQQRWAEKRNLAGIDLAKKRSSKGGGLEYHYSYHLRHRPNWSKQQDNKMK